MFSSSNITAFVNIFPEYSIF